MAIKGTKDTLAYFGSQLVTFQQSISLMAWLPQKWLFFFQDPQYTECRKIQAGIFKRAQHAPLELESWFSGLHEHLRLRTTPFPSQREVYSLLLPGETPAGEVLYLFFIVCRGVDSKKRLTLQLNVGHFPMSLPGRCSH